MDKIFYSLIIIFFLSLIVFFVLRKNNKKINKKGQMGTVFFIGTYTQNKSEGIYKYILSEDGYIDSIGLVVKTENPSYLAKSYDKKYILAVSEIQDGEVKSFKIKDDSLEYISENSSGGAHPCFISINKEGYILAANYSSGTVGLLKLDDKGKLSDLLDVQQHYGKGITERQKSPHAHSAWFEKNGINIISVDLGTDELLFSSIDHKKQKFLSSEQSSLKLVSGSGPRHIAFHPGGKWFYTVNELNSSVSLIKKKKNKYTLQSSFSTLPENFEGDNTCADIHISDDGKFLYASNRGHNSIAIFSIDQENGQLKLINNESTHGNGPRNFSLSPDNNFILVANQHTDNIVSFKRERQTGMLEYITEANAPVPVCILF